MTYATEWRDRATGVHHHAGIPEAVRTGFDVRVGAKTWWARRLLKLTCAKRTGHCYHPIGMVDWECCMCPAEADGFPPRCCRFCDA